MENLTPQRTKGFDVSRWQSKKNDQTGIVTHADFAKMKSAGAEFVYIRASIRTDNDPEFMYNWAAAKAAGLIRGAYMAIDYKINGTAQAQHFINHITDDIGELPPALDIERSMYVGIKASEVLARTKEPLAMLDEMAKKTPRRGWNRALVYTNPDALNYFGAKTATIPAWFVSHDLWLAHYRVETPTLAQQYTRWLIWQWNDRGDGLASGVQSKQIDCDWWNGDLNSLKKFCGLDQPDTPPGEKTIEERVKALEIWAINQGYKP